MGDRADSPASHAHQDENSFVRGGPFYRAQQALVVLRPGQWNAGCRIAALIAIGWLQAPERTTLANFGNSYEKIAQLKPFPADTGTRYVLAASVAIRVLPVFLAVVPLAVVLRDLFHALR